MTDTARIFLELTTKNRVTLYRMMPLNPHPNVATRAWRLWRPRTKGRKPAFYDVAISPEGWLTCTCPDAVYRSRECKHLRAMRAIGLLPKEIKNGSW